MPGLDDATGGSLSASMIRTAFLARTRYRVATWVGANWEPCPTCSLMLPRHYSQATIPAFYVAQPVCTSYSLKSCSSRSATW